MAANEGAGRSEALLRFWFGEGEESGRPRSFWFEKDGEVDREVRELFRGDYERAAVGELEGWKAAPRSCLALILLLDQVPRNIFREDPRSYATDSMAREAARSAVDAGFDAELLPVERWFVYLPFEHSESLEDQRRSVALFESLGGDEASVTVTYYARRHLEIIETFGRFPHRNRALGRESTSEEAAFLEEPGSSF